MIDVTVINDVNTTLVLEQEGESLVLKVDWGEHEKTQATIPKSSLEGKLVVGELIRFPGSDLLSMSVDPPRVLFSFTKETVRIFLKPSAIYHFDLVVVSLEEFRTAIDKL